MASSDFSTNMGYSRKVNSSGNANAPKVSPTSWDFDTDIENYTKTNTNTSKEGLTEADGSINLNMFIEPEEIGTVGTATVTDSLGLELADITEKAWYEELAEVAGKVGATVAVGTTSVLSGIYDIGEAILDGGAWVAAKAVGIFSEEGANAIEEFIARDLVSEANEYFYENTEIGKAINDASYMKYDSETAQGIRSITTTTTEIAAATALTVCTGGAAAPFVVGTMAGLGMAAESTYQNNGTDTTVMQELGILGSGALKGLSWVANGKLGSGAINIMKDCGTLGVKSVMTDIVNEMVKKDFWIKSLKEGLSLKNAKGKLNVNALLNYITSAFGTADTLIPYVIGEEEFDGTAALKIGGTYLSYLGLNVLEDTFRDYIGSYSISDEKAQELANKILNNEMDIDKLENSGLSRDSVYKVSDIVMKNDMLDSYIDASSTEAAFLDLMRRHDAKYGSGDAYTRLKEFCDVNSRNYHNYSLISSNDGGRDILRTYTPEQIEHFMNNLSYYQGQIGNVSGLFTISGSSASHTYGTDQGGIESLCNYELNGVSYSYRDAMNMYNNSLKNGLPIPHFRKLGTEEYFFLKNKLMFQGFSNRDASIIMSSVNDAGACSYATIINEIYSSYNGNETKFFNDFGYNMYKINSDGQKVFNSNELLLDLYVYANKKVNGGQFINADCSLNTTLLSDRKDVFGRNILDARNQEYMSGFDIGKNKRAIGGFLSSKHLSYDAKIVCRNNGYNTISDRDFNKIIQKAMADFKSGNGISLGIYSRGNNIRMISTNPNLYSSTSTGTWREGGGHSIFVTDIGKDGFYVSSWGQEYLIPFSDLKSGGMFNLVSSKIR